MQNRGVTVRTVSILPTPRAAVLHVSLYEHHPERLEFNKHTIQPDPRRF